MKIKIVNPLPEALAHYSIELNSILIAAGASEVTVDAANPVEGLSALEKIRVTGRAILRRWREAAAVDAVVVIWPSFGYLDALTWVRAARRGKVVLVVHDVRPLQRQFGYGRLARFLFAVATSTSGMTVVCHTEEAAEELAKITSVKATVASHPLLLDAPRGRARGWVVRVLGQFKPARSLAALEQVASQLGESGPALEIYGRGWPSVTGWKVEDRFLPEAEFQALISSASCVVLPYDRFYQSGVAIRCLEQLVPLVSRSHPQIESLYGSDWPGAVVGDDWGTAIRAAIEVEEQKLDRRRALAVAAAVHQWHAVLAHLHPSPSPTDVEAE